MNEQDENYDRMVQMAENLLNDVLAGAVTGIAIAQVNANGSYGTKFHASDAFALSVAARWLDQRILNSFALTEKVD